MLTALTDVRIRTIYHSCEISSEKSVRAPTGTNISVKTLSGHSGVFEKHMDDHVCIRVHMRTKVISLISYAFILSSD